MQVLWLTDTHFNYKRTHSTKELGILLQAYNADGVVLTGDISEGPTLVQHLCEFSEGIDIPVYFVTGNHDYYFSSFNATDAIIQNLSVKNLYPLRYLSPIILGKASLIGTGGWYDARYSGTPWSLMMQDFFDIEDLVPGKDDYKIRSRISQERADILASELLQQLKSVKTKDIIIATHVPPYDGAAWYRGAISDPSFLPWFTDMACGKVIDSFAQDNPDKRIKIICGHCHSNGIFQRSSNIKVYTGKAFADGHIAGVISIENVVRIDC